MGIMVYKKYVSKTILTFQLTTSSTVLNHLYVTAKMNLCSMKHLFICNHDLDPQWYETLIHSHMWMHTQVHNHVLSSAVPKLTVMVLYHSDGITLISLVLPTWIAWPYHSGSHVIMHDSGWWCSGELVRRGFWGYPLALLWFHQNIQGCHSPHFGNLNDVRWHVEMLVVVLQFNSLLSLYGW